MHYYNPYELIYMSRMGDTNSMSVLFRDYQPYLVYVRDSMIGKHSAFNSMNEELLLELKISLFEATLRYREDQETSWRTFATVLMKRKLMNEIRKADVRDWIDHTVSFDCLVREEEDSYKKVASKDFFGQPENYLDYKDGLDKINQVVRTMSEKEKNYVYFWVNQVSCEEGSTYMNVSKKRWYKQMNRVQQKVRDTLKS